MDSPPNPFASSPSSSISQLPPLPPSTSTSPPPPRPPSSLLSAASGSPPPSHRASFPDPSKEPRGAALGDRLVGPKAKEGFCCDRDREVHKGEEISIVDAYKTTEGGKASYITYVIRLGAQQTRRRYSAFLQLHQALTGLYPVLIIPPIPSKQSIAEYAVKGQSKAKEDATIIARRKRLLEDFLRRLLRHPILSGEHVLHRFLEDGVSWSEVMHSPPVSLLPKNPLHTPSHNPTFQPSSPNEAESTDTPAGTAYIAHHLLPTPSPNHPLKHPDQRFHDSEVFTEKFQTHFSGTMEKVNRRLVKRWGERAGDLSELGAVWNGYSLVEGGKLGLAVEKVGQAVDQEYLATAALLQAWERVATEPLHIYTQFATLIRSRLSFRHQKHVQYELVQEALDHQKDKLEGLEVAEKEARRLEEALERGGSRIISNPDATDEERIRERELEREREREREKERNERYPKKAGASQGFGLFNAVKHSLSGMMDVDPEATRRANIGKTRDNISQLEDSLQASAQDLKYASMTLQADLDRFQRQKVADLRNMAIQLAKVHREWCKQNLEAWQAAQASIREIESHPNQPPPEATPVPPPKIEFDPATAPPTEMPGQSSLQSPYSDTNGINGKDGRGGSTFSVGGLRGEIDRIEAANVPLPLPESDTVGEEAKGKGKSKDGFESPLGPL